MGKRHSVAGPVRSEKKAAREGAGSRHELRQDHRTRWSGPAVAVGTRKGCKGQAVSPHGDGYLRLPLASQVEDLSDQPDQSSKEEHDSGDEFQHLIPPLLDYKTVHG